MGDSSKLNTKKNKSKEQMEMIFGVSPVNTYKVIHDAALSFKKRFIEFEGKVSNTSWERARCPSFLIGYRPFQEGNQKHSYQL